MKKRILSLLLCVAMCLSMVTMLSGCKQEEGKKADALVIMTDALDGLFNPFFSTSGADGTIVGMTQISLMGASYKNGEVTEAFGEDEPVAALDYMVEKNADGTYSYYFVLKNGIKFSDGHPLTMEDVLFNFYTYLDPVYTGSSTMYSTKILGLMAYRTQKLGDTGDDSNTNTLATNRARMRRQELVTIFNQKLKELKVGVTDYDMREAIAAHTLSGDYKNAISNNPSEVTNEQLLADYERTLELFRAELKRDFESAKSSYTDTPYKEHAEFQDEVFKFLFMEGYVGVEYELDADGKKDRNNIKELTKNYPAHIDTMEEAIEYVFTDKTNTELHYILLAWATAGELLNEFVAKAKEVILHSTMEDGELLVPNIEGIVSLGHTSQAGQKITVNGTEYTIASGHNADGTVTNETEHDILKITIEDVDPKAVWNFCLTVAPQHYYGEGSSVGVDIPNNKFGVEYASYDFMSKVIQSVRNVKLPMGAGVYKVSNASNSDNPGESEFYSSNVCYFKANENFETVGKGLHNAYIEKVRYQVVSSNNAIPNLKNGTVHYISPSLTQENYDTLEGMKSDGFVSMSTDQLGYGYIGVNAGKVTNIYLRRAIMCAMNTALALDYYRVGTASQIYWNMSKVSWAYPQGSDATDNDHVYPQAGNFDEGAARDNIRTNMDLAANNCGGYTEEDLKVTFTIAGSSLQDHPTYKVFRDAAALLNSMGWQVDVVCDAQALTKISTGSLEVWAAAWSSSLDPDMYQVYHKNSSATSVKAWGYPEMLQAQQEIEMDILDALSLLIEQGRETNDKNERKEIYMDAMKLVLDLAVELPVYQRDVLYAYNANVLDSESMPAESELNPYSSPLDRIWELKLK